MSFTTVTVVGTLERPDGVPAEGRLIFTPTADMENGTLVAMAVPIEAVLDDNGAFSVGLVATDDPGTSPSGVEYAVTIDVEHEGRSTRYAPLTHTVSPVDITDLIDIGVPSPTFPDTQFEILVHRGAPSGYAPLDGSSKVPLANLPGSLPPSGTAGGDLTGSYPNPTIGAGKVTSAAIADGAIVDADVSGSAAIASSKISGGLPPTGTAGGDLTGTYPNPAVSTGAITSAKIADGTIVDADVSGSAAIASSKIAGSLPPSGAASGDLAGTYPGPTVGVAAVTSGRVAQGLIPTAVKTANYTAAAQDFVPVDTTSGAVTITLPSAPADKTRIGVKMVTQGGTNTVTVARGGSDVFNKAGGSTSLTLTLLMQDVVLQYASSTGIWFVVSDDIPLGGLDARYVALTKAGREQLETVDNAPLRQWRAALANRGSARANVVVVGDSVAEGTGQTLIHDRWINRLADNLRNRYPIPGVAGGVGFIPPQYISTTQAQPVLAGGSLTAEYQWGPGGRAVQWASPVTITYTVTGTSFDVWYAKGSSAGVLGYSIDGGGVVSITETNALFSQDNITHVAFSSRATHTIQFSAVSGTVNLEGIVVYDGDESAGIMVNDFAHHGSGLAAMTTGGNPGSALTGQLNAISADLVIVSLGANDQGLSTSTFSTDLATLIGYITAATKVPSIMVLVEYDAFNVGPGQWASTFVPLYYSEVAGANQAIMDLSLRFPIGTGNANPQYGLYYSDNVHPSVIGAGYLADHVTEPLCAR